MSCSIRVCRWLPEKEAAEGIRKRHQAYATVAWRFLNACGVINFGVSPEIVKHMVEEPVTQPPILVVGAGMAGGLEKFLVSEKCCCYPTT